MIAPMLIQPLIENAIVHGLFPEKGKCRLDVGIQIQDFKKTIPVTIEDNGIGREKSLEIKANRITNKKSYAAAAVRNRLALLNNISSEENQLTMEDLYDQNSSSSGTRVQINMAYQNVGKKR
jgi:sensor histidine kinase YesM